MLLLRILQRGGRTERSRCSQAENVYLEEQKARGGAAGRVREGRRAQDARAQMCFDEEQEALDAKPQKDDISRSSFLT